MLIDLKPKILDYTLMERKNCYQKLLTLVILIGEQMLVMQMIHQTLKLMLVMETKDLYSEIKEIVNKLMLILAKN